MTSNPDTVKDQSNTWTQGGQAKSSDVAATTAEFLLAEAPIPEATLEQLGLANANFGFAFEPQYFAMDDGIDCPGGCWHLFEDLPSFDPVTLSWQNEGNAWESGVDDSEDLHYTPEFQRWVKAEFSLVRVVETATAAPQYHPLAYMTPAV